MLRFLRLLVTTLTAVMIVGILGILVVLVTRLRDTGPVLPEEVTLPDGTAPVAVTAGPGWYAVVTDDNRILIFDRLTGTLRQSVNVRQGDTEPSDPASE